MRPPEYLPLANDDEVDLSIYPEKFLRRQLKGGEKITFPDMHASAEKMIFGLMMEGVLEVSEPDYVTLFNISNSLDELSAADDSVFIDILFNKAVFNIEKLGYVQYQGDLVCDRRKNDRLIFIILTAFTRAILKWIKDKNPNFSDADALNAIWTRQVVKLIIIWSNHDAEFIRNFVKKTLDNPKCCIPSMEHTASIHALSQSIKKGVVKLDDLQKMVIEGYLPHLRFYDFSIISLQRIQLYPHAQIDLGDVQRLHKLFKIDPPGNLADLLSLILFSVEVDAKFRALVKKVEFATLLPSMSRNYDGGCAPREDSVERFLWNRTDYHPDQRTINYSVDIVHGHTGTTSFPHPNTNRSIQYVNLDHQNDLGRSPKHIRGKLNRVVTFSNISIDLIKALGSDSIHDINHRNNHGATALYRAAENGQVELVHLLILQDGIDIDSINETTNLSALDIAQKNGHPAVVKLLTGIIAKLARLRFKPPLDANSQELQLLVNSFPWEEAPDVVHKLSPALASEIIVKILQLKPNIFDKDELLLIELLSKTSERYNTLINGTTVLHLAVEAGKVDIVKELIYRRADIGTKNQHGITAIQRAADIAVNEQTSEANKAVAWEMVAVIAAGKKNRTIDAEGLGYALLKAAQVRKWDIVPKLLKRGATLTEIDKETGFTALHYAVLYNDEAEFTRLHDAGADVNSQPSVQFPSPLILATTSRAVAYTTFSYLLKLPKLELNKRCQGKTALYLAAEEGNVEKVRALLAMENIDAEAKCIPGEGTTAVDIARTNNHNAVVELLNTPEIFIKQIKFYRIKNNTKDLIALLIKKLPWPNKADVINLMSEELIGELFPLLLKSEFQNDTTLILDLLARALPEGYMIVLEHAVMRYNLAFLKTLLEFMEKKSITLDSKSDIIEGARKLTIDEKTQPENKRLAWQMICLLAQYPLIKFNDKSGFSLALLTAASVGDWETVINLSRSAVPVNAFFPETGYCAIHFAVLANNAQAIEELVAAGGNINFQGLPTQDTPLVLAAKAPQVTPATLQGLVHTPGIDVHKEVNKKSAFSIAYSLENSKKLNVLLSCKVKPLNGANGINGIHPSITNGTHYHLKQNLDLDAAPVKKLKTYILFLLKNRVPDIKMLMTISDLLSIMSEITILQLLQSLIEDKYSEEIIIKKYGVIKSIHHYLEVRDAKIRLKPYFFSDENRVQQNMDFFNQFFAVEGDPNAEENKPAREDIRYFLLTELKDYLSKLSDDDAVNLANVKLTCLFWATQQAAYITHLATGFFETMGKTTTHKELVKMIEPLIEITQSHAAPRP